MGPTSGASNGDRRSSASPLSGFVAVNAKQSVGHEPFAPDGYPYDPLRTANVTVVNGTSLHGASAAVRAELLGKFFTNSELAAAADHDPSRCDSISTARMSATSRLKGKPTSEPADYAGMVGSASPVPIPHTPSVLLPYVKPSVADRFDDNGPYKAAMVARMEQLQRGDRIQPPCDRCRRLHMDCRKNLTACMGCTKKHAKCSWKEVLEDELRENPYNPSPSMDETGVEDSSEREGSHRLPIHAHDQPAKREYPRDDQIGVRDEELLGEDPSSDEDRELPGPEAREVAEDSSPKSSHPNHVSSATMGKTPDSSESPKPDDGGRGSVSADEKPVGDGPSYDHLHSLPRVNGHATDVEGLLESESLPEESLTDSGPEESRDILVQLRHAAAEEASEPSPAPMVLGYGPSIVVAVPATETV